MNVQDLRSIVTNVNAKPTMPVSVRVNFGDDAKSYTMADITSFNQFTDVFLLNAKIEYPEIDKLIQFRQWLVEETKRFLEQAKADMKKIGECISDFYAEEEKRQKWEYKVVSNPFQSATPERMLNKEGNDGWELVAIAMPANQYIFKRPIIKEG